MPALPPYIPPRDTDLATWSLNFSDTLTASPAAYGLLASDATIVANADSSWQSAYAAAVNPATRTPVTVAAKDTARTILLSTVRPYAQQIALNAGVSTDDKIAIGVNPRTSTPTPIAAPTTTPILALVGASALQHVLRYRDADASPTTKAKPYGVFQLYLFGVASATPPTDPDALPLLAGVTKSPTLIQWSSADIGKQAWYRARWATRTGKVGPWSSMVNFTITGALS